MPSIVRCFDVIRAVSPAVLRKIVEDECDCCRATISDAVGRNFNLTAADYVVGRCRFQRRIKLVLRVAHVPGDVIRGYSLTRDADNVATALHI
jgi:hypothetical protein